MQKVFATICQTRRRLPRNDKETAYRREKHHRSVVNDELNALGRAVRRDERREEQKETTLPATQVCVGTVESGLGGNEAGVFGDDEGVENTSLPLRKRGRMTLSVCATFSHFVGIGNDYVGKK